LSSTTLYPVTIPSLQHNLGPVAKYTGRLLNDRTLDMVKQQTTNGTGYNKDVIIVYNT